MQKRRPTYFTHFQTLLLFALAVLYIAFLTLDFYFGSTRAADVVKFGSIVCCALLAGTVAHTSRDGLLVAVALGLTLLADALLLFTALPLAGVACFCCVQLVHIRRFSGRAAAALLPAAALLLNAIALDAYTLRLLPTREVLCICYAALLLTSCALALRSRTRFAAGGMLLFLMCDICVALFNLYTGPTSWMAYRLIWLFYTPSQLLLVLSTFPFAQPAQKLS